MNRFTQSGDSTVLFRMSTDAEAYRANKGKFMVRYENGRQRVFRTLLDAFLFYYTVDEEAQLWDKTAKPVLIECKVKMHLN